MRRALQLVLLLLPLSAFAQLYPNTDDTLSGWQSPPCLGTACAGGTGTATAYFQTIDNSTPSLDGESMEIGFTGPSLTSGETTNVLWPHKVGANGAVTALSGTWHVYFPNAGLIQAKELDIFQFVGGQRFMYGTECDNPALTAGFLRIWNQCANSNGGAWITTSIACPLFSSSNTWHSFTLNTHRVIGDTSCTGGNPCEYYDSIVIDGTVHTGFTPQCSAPNSEPDNIGIQTQIDESSAGGTVTEFEDEMSLTLATGGLCPSGASYINPVNPTGSLVTLASLGVTSCFYVAANGSDANSGAAESSAWLHPPGCTNFTGSYIAAPGNAIIFRGGDTWNFGSVTSPACGAQTWAVPLAGTSGTPNYIGVDPTWFSGSSFARPIFSGDNAITTAPFFTCSSNFNNVNVVNLGASGNVMLDDIEFSGFCADEATDPDAGVVSYDGSNAYVLRTYHHGFTVPKTFPVSSVANASSGNTVYTGVFTGCAANACNGLEFSVSQLTHAANNSGLSNPAFWTVTASTATALTLNNAGGVAETNPGLINSYPRFDEQTAIHGRGNGYRFNTTNGIFFNVFDNSDGTLGTWGSYPNAGATLEAIQTAGGVVAFNVFNRVSNGNVGTSGSMHDNLFHDMYEPLGAVHGNIWNSDNDAMAAGSMSFYNNVFFNINEGVSVWLMSTSVDYLFNNIAWNNSNSANCYVFGGSSQSTGLPTTTLNFYNNTNDAPCNLRFLNNGSDPKWHGTANFNNNHLIGYSPAALSSIYSVDSGATMTPNDVGNEIFQTEAAANAQGYTRTNAYAPTTSGGATVGAGANNTSSCSTFSTDSDMCSGIASVNETGGQGGQVVTYPANAASARPSSRSWDSGAYEFASTAPQNLTVTVAGGGTVVSSPAGISCPGTCSTNFTDGTNVTLTATPSLGYEFSQWVGSCTGTTGCGLIMTSAQSTSASFVNTYLRVTTNTNLATGLCAPSGLPGSGTGLCLPFSTTQNNATVNSTAFDASLNPLTNCQTLIFDQNSRAGASVGNVTSSGGTEDIFGSLTGQYIFLTVAGGVDSILNINTSGACAQVNNTGALSTAGSGVYPNTNGNIVGSAGWSHVTESSFAWLDEHNCVTHCTGVPNPSTSAYSVLYFGSVTGTPPLANPISYTGSYGFDFRQCPGVGTVTSGVSSTALSIMGQDQYYGMGISFTGGQGTGFLYFIWSPTLGCETLDTSTGNVYTWCNSFPCPTTVGSGNAYYIGQETTCYGASGSNGIHDAFERSTNFAKIAQAGSGWTNCGGSGQTSVVWNYQQTTVCNSGCPGPTTVQACTVSCGGHDSSGQLYLLKFNDPSPNRRLFSNLAVETQVASILIGVHGVIMPDPSGFDVGAWALMAQGASTAGNTGFGFNNPPATLYENEMFGIVNWQPASYTGSNPQVSRFGHNYDAENFEAPATALNVTSTTSATITAINVFPPCEANGSCGQLQISTTGFSPNVTGLITSISPAGIVVSGTGYTVGTQSCGGTCTILGNTPNFGCQNAIGFVDQSQTWYVAGYDAFGQMGADSSNQVFCAAIMGRLNAVETFPTGLTISVGNQASQGVQIKP